MCDFWSKNIKYDEELGILKEVPEDEVEVETVNAVLDNSGIIEAQRADKFCKEIIKGIEGTQELKKFERLSRQFEQVSEVLFKNAFSPEGAYRLVVLPESLRVEVFEEYHDSAIFGGHCGKRRMAAKLSEKYYFPNLQNLCSEYVRSCEKCQMNKIRSGLKVGAMESIKVVSYPMKVINLDTSGPYNRSVKNNYHIVSLIDYCPRYMYLCSSCAGN